MKPLLSQLRSELTVMARNGEQLLLILIIPLGLLAFFATVDLLPTGTSSAIDFLVPGVIALAVMSTAMVSLGIATGFERQYLVLKRLGATPLGTSRLVLAKTIAVIVIELAQIALIIALGVALGWSPSAAAWSSLALAVILATSAFSGLGLLLAGRLRAEINLAAQNGLYLVMLLFGGILIDVESLPRALARASEVLPATALANVLRTGVAGDAPFTQSSWWVLLVWAIGTPLAAIRLFRFEPSQR